MSTRCDLSIIIVSWNVWHLLSACLRSIEQVSQPTVDANLRSFGPRFGPLDLPSMLEVIVVDNASSDGTAEQVSRTFPWVNLVRSESNLGFTKGNNLGVQQSRGQILFFLNPDTEISLSPPRPEQTDHSTSRADSLWNLYEAVYNDETVGMAGPQLRYADGTWQNSRRRFPTPLTGFFESTWLGHAWPNNPWVRKMHMRDWPATYRHDVDWITGAAMMMKRTSLSLRKGVKDAANRPNTPSSEAEAPIFDERFFMYSEELDLCKRIHDAGWRILYVPESVFIHYEGRSSEQVVALRHIHFNTSKVRYWHKWFGSRWGETLRRYLLFEYRWQLASEWIKAMLGHKRELRKARVAAYREVIEKGLHAK